MEHFGLENIKMARHLKEIYQITFVDPSCFYFFTTLILWIGVVH